MKNIVTFCILSIVLITCIASAEMDWENMLLKSSSTDKSTAFDLLKRSLYLLQYDKTQTVGDFLSTHFDRENRLTNLFLECSSVKQNYLTDGQIEYVYLMSLKNKIMSLLLPAVKATKFVVPMLCPYCGQDWPMDKEVPEGLNLIPKQIESSEYTGIIVDCRDLQIDPCLFPRICDEIGEEVYSINFANLNSVVEEGLVLYTHQDLFNNLRVGYNPLRIQAIGVHGDKSTDIKISSFDARRIHGSQKIIQLLRECRVAIITGQ